MKKIDKLMELAKKENSKEMIQLVFFAKECQDELDCAFENSGVSLSRLDLAISLFIDDLKERNVFKGKDVFLYTQIIFFIVRHTWEFVDERGKLKTGDVLHTTNPFYFNGEKTLELEDLFQAMKSLYRVKIGMIF